jgi:hypothetical protein
MEAAASMETASVEAASAVAAAGRRRACDQQERKHKYTKK